jgi:3-oxoacyl-[acyl-carrier-protein] synthase-1
MRAKKSEPRATHLRDKRDQAVGACLTGGIRPDCYGYERMGHLAAAALRECTAAATDTDFALVLAMPEAERPYGEPLDEAAWIERLSERSDVRFDSEATRVVRSGHAGFAQAMELALAWLDEGKADVLVGGVDSYFDPAVIEWLDTECRLHAIGAEDGFLPSEGAGFVWLRQAAGADDDTHGAALARVSSVACAQEQTVANGEPVLGETMTKLLRDIADEHGGEPTGWVLPDLNGERHRMREWGMVNMRQVLDRDAVESRCVEELGDTGAASGALFLAIATQWWRSGVEIGRAHV